MKQQINKTKRLTVSAMLSALGVVILYLGSLIEVIDISMAVIASMLCIMAVIEYGKSYSWLVYAVTSVLSLLLLQNKSAAVMYAVFFGYYPILKEIFEKRGKIYSWILKEITFNAAFALCFVILKFLLFAELEIPNVPPELMIYAYIGFILLCEVVFVLYDIALTRLISVYVFRIRQRLKIDKNK